MSISIPQLFIDMNDENGVSKDKKIGIMQSYFFPYIGYFQLIDAADIFILYEHVSFRRKSWIHRNRILDKGRQTPVVIGVPLIKQSSFQTIENTHINENTAWRKKMLQLLFFNYKKAPFFEIIYPIIERLISNKSLSIHTYNSHIIIGLTQLLGLDTKIIRENRNYVKMEQNLEHISLSYGNEEKEQRIFEICKNEDIYHYVNPIGGTELYDKKKFKENGFQLSFIETHNYSYKQFGGSFEPHLSIIDVLMHNGIEVTKKMIKNYTLV